MIDGPAFVDLVQRCGISHVVWIPDSELGAWDAALASASSVKLIRATREGEALAIAGGLWLGGVRPLAVLQITGFFESGDALRNIVHDLKIPLPLVIGLRSYHAHLEGRSSDTCPVFAEPVLQAWRLPYTLLNRDFTARNLEGALRAILDSGTAGAVVIGE